MPSRVAPGTPRSSSSSKRVCASVNGSARSAVDRVHAARREKDELCVVASAELEAGVGAEEIRADHAVEPAAVDARQDGWLG